MKTTRIRAGALALLLLAPLTGPARAQGDSLSETYTKVAEWTAAAHRRAVWSERASLLLDELAGAQAEARRRSEARVFGARPDGARASWYPTIETLSLATREITGLDTMGPMDPRRQREQRELQAIVDAVDLVVVPGGFAPRSSGLGEAMTVHVRTAFRPQGLGTLEVRLNWVSPAGRVIRARAEPASIELLRGGFPMYVRPPSSEPGRWRLVPELEMRGVTSNGIGVIVDCHPDFEGLAQRPEPADARFDRAWLRGALASRYVGGARIMLALGAEEAFGLLDTDERAQADAERARADAERARADAERARAGADTGEAPGWRGPRPWGAAFKLSDGDERQAWSYVPAGGGRELLLIVLCPDHELADLPLAGELGRRWRAACDRLDARLICSNAPPAGASLGTGALVEALIAGARERGLPDSAKTVVVARGSTAGHLALLPIEGLDCAVLSTVLKTSEPERVMAGTTRLLVSPGGAEALPAEPGEFTWVDGRTVPLLNDLDLPELVADWLGRL